MSARPKTCAPACSQYFLPGGDGRYMVPYLIAKVEHIDTIIVHSEKEALLLENNLHQTIPARAIMRSLKTIKRTLP